MHFLSSRPSFRPSNDEGTIISFQIKMLCNFKGHLQLIVFLCICCPWWPWWFVDLGGDLVTRYYIAGRCSIKSDASPWKFSNMILHKIIIFAEHFHTFTSDFYTPIMYSENLGLKLIFSYKDAQSQLESYFYITFFSAPIIVREVKLNSALCGKSCHWLCKVWYVFNEHVMSLAQAQGKKSHKVLQTENVNNFCEMVALM